MGVGTTETGLTLPSYTPWVPVARLVHSTAVMPGTVLLEVLAPSHLPSLVCVLLSLGLRVYTWDDPGGPASRYP